MTQTQAAIKRATDAARRGMDTLDTTAVRELEAIYRDAAADIAARIRAHAGADDNLSLQELRSVLAQIEARLRDLAQARDAVLTQGLTQAAELGVKPYLAVTPQGVAVQTAASVRIANDALQFVRSFVAADGLQLSDRLWRIDRGARDAVVNAIERAVITGQGAQQAAREFLARGQAVPGDIAAKVNAANSAGIARETNAAMLTGEGNAMDNAMRVFRTEINRAHGVAYMKGGEDHPDFGGWRFLLSPMHPKHDICDLYATQNLHGLGPGVYPSMAQINKIWPAHPNTFSYIDIVFKDEISAADRAGKETTMEALAALPDEVRAGVLGKGKHELWREGKISKGMIRTPLNVVQRRLERKGVAV